MDFSERSALNRTSSVPNIRLANPVCRRIVVEEYYHQHDSNVPIIRHFSCEEIYSDHNKKMDFTTNTNQNKNYESINYQKEPILPLMSMKTDSCETPMDVDSDDFEGISSLQTCSTPNKIDNNHVVQDTLINKTTESVDRYISSNTSQIKHINANNHKKTDLFLKPKRRLSFIFILSIVAVILALLYTYVYMRRGETILLQNIRRDLNEMVVGQDDSVIKIVQNLQYMDSENDYMKSLLFIGSTGIGKTYITNIIKNHFPDSFVHEINGIYLNDLDHRKNIFKLLSNMHCNLLIIDDLSVNNINDVVEFINGIHDVKCMLVISVFNVQETNDNLEHSINYNLIESIPRKFKETNIDFETVNFNIVTHDIIEGWLRKELINRNIEESKHSSIIESLLEEHDVQYLGFKGLNAKLNLIQYKY